jgi:16S rRNA (adenine1518-N6/adenine1519-N6)-dimethyltransferase
MKKDKRKALGQHFLIKRNILKKIVNVIDPQPEDLIIEIGAGKGALTFPLAKKGSRVIAIERDSSLVSYLKNQVFPNLTILERDVLQVNFKDLVQKKRAKIVGNLPYAISSPLLFKVLDDKDLFSACVFLLQKEVAQRLCAHPGTKKFAPLSILFQNDFVTRLHFHVPPSSFYPAPQVESALVSLKRRPHPCYFLADQERFHTFLKGTFRSRRKKLKNNLKNLHLPESEIRNALHICGIDEDLRPEQVSLSQFVALFEALHPDNVL